MATKEPKAVWVFHFPVKFPDTFTHVNNTLGLRRRRKGRHSRELDSTECPYCSYEIPELPEWSYKEQNLWGNHYPSCNGRSQSPVDLPTQSLILVHGARPLIFNHYDEQPTQMVLQNNGKSLTLFAKWEKQCGPTIYGGAAHSRRYLFHSLSLHWPSEHTVGGLQYPFETQAMHISAEYSSMEEAIRAAPKDPLAFLIVSTIYKFGNHTHSGLKNILYTARWGGVTNCTIVNRPLSYFSPPVKDYSCYYGSLTTPPCTESVLWFVRGRAFTVTREAFNVAQKLRFDGEVMFSNFRQTQPLNDRRVFYFQK